MKCIQLNTFTGASITLRELKVILAGNSEQLKQHYYSFHLIPDFMLNKVDHLLGAECEGRLMYNIWTGMISQF